MLNQSRPTTLVSFENELSCQPLEADIGNFSEDEVERAIRKLKNSKAAGAGLFTEELMKHGGPDTIKALMNLLNCCWKQQQVPEDWRNGVKLPKKGNLA